jgi:hypothetical protein
MLAVTMALSQTAAMAILAVMTASLVMRVPIFGGRRLSLVAHGGTLTWQQSASLLDPRRPTLPLKQWPTPSEMHFARLGYRFSFSYSSASSWAVYATIPLWGVVVLFQLAPTVYLARAWRSRRLRAKGRCVVCGYDLRASPDRCPECGAPRPGVPSVPGSSTSNP